MSARRIDRTGQATQGGWRAVAEEGISAHRRRIYRFECVTCGHVKRVTWDGADRYRCPRCLGTPGERTKIERVGQVTPGGWRAEIESGKDRGGTMVYRFGCVKCGHVKRAVWAKGDENSCPTCAKREREDHAARLELEAHHGFRWTEL